MTNFILSALQVLVILALFALVFLAAVFFLKTPVQNKPKYNSIFGEVVADHGFVPTPSKIIDENDTFFNKVEEYRNDFTG